MDSVEDRNTLNEADIRKVAFASAIGCTIEWYDFFLYNTFAALIFNKLFFPSFDPLVGTMLAYTTALVGFIARPVAGVIFGHFGDRVGRKKMLILTLLIMGLGTFLIGLLPTYDTIGVGHRSFCWCCASRRAWASAASGAAQC